LDYSIDDLLERAHQAAENVNLAATRCVVLTQIADSYFQQNNTLKSETVLAEALKVADLLKHPAEKSKQLAWLSRLLKQSGDATKATEQFTRAYYLARAAESVSQKISALYYLASEYLDAGMMNESKTILVELEPLVLDPASEIDTVCELINISEIYADMEDAAGTARLLSGAVRAALGLKDLWFKAERLIEIAVTYCSSGCRTQAADLIQEALAEVEKIEERSRPYFWMKLADVYIELDSKTQAADCLLKAREAILRSDDLYTAGNEVLELAESYLRLGEHSLAISLLEKGQTIIGDLPEKQDRIQLLFKSAGLSYRLSENPKTLELIEKIYQLNSATADIKAKLYVLGKLAILNTSLMKNKRAAALVDEICAIVSEAKTKTSGLGAIGEDLIAAGDPDLALRLAEIIREPEVKAGVFIAAAKTQIENQDR
jgi:tetratricopeptide (TPR) repeat protein